MESLARAFRHIDRCGRVYTAKAVRDSGLNPAELQALRHIVWHGVCNQQELARDLGVDKAAVARLAAGLEQKGYVVREPDPEDKRSKLMRATETAAGISDEMVSEEDRFFAWLTAELPPDELRQFSETLDQLRRRAVEERGCCFAHLRGEDADGTR